MTRPRPLAVTLALPFALAAAAAVARADGERAPVEAKDPPPKDGKAHDSLDPHNAEAARLEREGKAALERGDRAHGAELLAKSWATRARVFAEEARRAAARSIDELRARSAALEKEAGALRDAGRGADAQARIDEAATLWKKAEALAERERARLATVVAPAGKAAAEAARAAQAQAEKARRAALDSKARRTSAVEAGESLQRDDTDQRRKQAAALEAEAADLWAAGRLAVAEERWGQAAALRESVAADLRRLAAQRAAAERTEADAKAAVRSAQDARLERLAQQVEALTKAVKALEARLAAKEASPPK